MQNDVLIIFCERFRTSCCISPTNFKKKRQFQAKLSVFKISWRNTTAVAETFTEK